MKMEFLCNQCSRPIKTTSGICSDGNIRVIVHPCVCTKTEYRLYKRDLPEFLESLNAVTFEFTKVNGELRVITGAFLGLKKGDTIGLIRDEDDNGQTKSFRLSRLHRVSFAGKIFDVY